MSSSGMDQCFSYRRQNRKEEMVGKKKVEHAHKKEESSNEDGRQVIDVYRAGSKRNKLKESHVKT